MFVVTFMIKISIVSSLYYTENSTFYQTLTKTKLL